MTHKVRSNKWSELIDELEERSFQGVTLDMEDLSFVYFLAKDTTDVFEMMNYKIKCNTRT